MRSLRPTLHIDNYFKRGNKMNNETLIRHFSKGVVFSVYLLILCCFVCLSKATSAEISGKLSSSQELRYPGKDRFLLSGQYYAAAKQATGQFSDDEQAAGVLLLHDCEHDSRSYSYLGKSLSEKGLHAFAIDFRGYANSADDIFSRKNIKKKAQNIAAYQKEMVRLTAYWGDDVLAAHNLLRSKVDKHIGIAVVASGCSVNYAVSLAEKVKVAFLVVVSPEMNFAAKERYKNLLDIPTYFIYSTDHLESFNTTKELFSWNGSDKTKAQVFKGSRVGNTLLKKTYHLEEDIAQWLKYSLSR